MLRTLAVSGLADAALHVTGLASVNDRLGDPAASASYGAGMDRQAVLRFDDVSVQHDGTRSWPRCAERCPKGRSR